LYVVNIVFVSYFLLGAVRAPYFNPRLRWWESKPRYLVQLKAVVSSSTLNQKCTILDISEGGAFIKTAMPLLLGDVVRLDISFLDRTLSVVGHVVHCGRSEVKGYGVQFLNGGHAAKKAIRKLIETFAVIGLETRPRRPDWVRDFFGWAMRLLTTGQGFLPELPKKGASNKGSPEEAKIFFLNRHNRKKAKKKDRNAA
ncbi:MAG: PilZ domain-containing protein, partial [Bdellovibrionota bacterium]